MRILPSKRAHLYVLERCRIVLRDGRVEYISDEGREPRGFNIPIANTCFLLIGPGSSITTEAVRALKSEGVCIGFSGSGGTPLLAAEDPFPDLLLPADEYRDPRFLQKWISIWSDPARRLAGAKLFMAARLDQIESKWGNLDLDFSMPACPDQAAMEKWRRSFERAKSTEELLGIEGALAKSLYAILAQTTQTSNFVRAPKTSDDIRDPNRLLDHGNYLAYGLGSVCLWILGIPASLSLVHGKTRRGGLVFDVADIIKDAVIMPTAFAYAARARSGEALSEVDFRSACITFFDDTKSLEVLLNNVIKVAEECSSVS